MLGTQMQMTGLSQRYRMARNSTAPRDLSTNEVIYAPASNVHRPTPNSHQSCMTCYGSSFQMSSLEPALNNLHVLYDDKVFQTTQTYYLYKSPNLCTEIQFSVVSLYTKAEHDSKMTQRYAACYV